MGLMILGILNNPAKIRTVAHKLERRRVIFEDLPPEVHVLVTAWIEDV